MLLHIFLFDGLISSLCFAFSCLFSFSVSRSCFCQFQSFFSSGWRCFCLLISCFSVQQQQLGSSPSRSLWSVLASARQQQQFVAQFCLWPSSFARPHAPPPVAGNRDPLVIPILRLSRAQTVLHPTWTPSPSPSLVPRYVPHPSPPWARTPGWHKGRRHLLSSPSETLATLLLVPPLEIARAHPPPSISSAAALPSMRAPPGVSRGGGDPTMKPPCALVASFFRFGSPETRAASPSLSAAPPVIVIFFISPTA